MFESLSLGGTADTADGGGVSPIQGCPYHGDVSGVRFLVSRGASLDALGPTLDLDGAAFHGH